MSRLLRALRSRLRPAPDLYSAMQAEWDRRDREWWAGIEVALRATGQWDPRMNGTDTHRRLRSPAAEPRWMGVPPPQCKPLRM